MVREIGSIFELDGMCLGYDKQLKMKLVEKFLAHGYEDFLAAASGREALLAAVYEIAAQKHLRCLLPMYTCDTVIAPFDYYGMQLLYYPVTKNLSPDSAVFEQMLTTQQVEVVVVHAYYGVDTLAPIREMLRKFQQQGGIVIEDLTQCLFMEPDYQADYYAVSLRKWLNIPDGGLLISKRRLGYKPRHERTDFVKRKWIAMTDKYAYLQEIKDLQTVDRAHYRNMQTFKAHFLEKHVQAEEMLDQDLSVYRMSEKSKYIANLTDWERDCRQRAENALYLSRRLDRDTVRTAGMICPQRYTGKEAPLYFPVYIEEQKAGHSQSGAAARQAFQQFMREQAIYIPVLWPVPEQIEQMDAQTQYIYNHILGIPCDQRYTQADMERVAAAALAYWRC